MYPSRTPCWRKSNPLVHLLYSSPLTLYVIQFEVPVHCSKLPTDIGTPAGGSLTADQWLLLATLYGPIVVSWRMRQVTQLKLTWHCQEDSTAVEYLPVWCCKGGSTNWLHNADSPTGDREDEKWRETKGESPGSQGCKVSGEGGTCCRESSIWGSLESGEAQGGSREEG